jgi:catechol 2,3-dioxygenase-like lactoylglutathione lyase family enzyme
MALRVDDLDSLLARLDQLRVRYRRIDPIPGAGLQAFLADPSGNRIELNQQV